MSETDGVSRRDFLRKASKQAAKEAIDVGTKVVPAVGLARTFLQSSSDTTPPTNADDEAPSPAAETPPPAPSTPSPAKNPFAFLAAWRAKRHNRDDDTH